MRRMARQFWILVTLGLGVSLPAYADFTFYYSADPIEAKVVDADTKQPLAGVIVVAHWELVFSTLGGDTRAGQLKVMEAVTDKNGNFRFPGWGPKLAVRSHLSDYQDPELLLFKSGYEYRRLYNALTGEDKGAKRKSDWNGKTIAMIPFKGTTKEYLERFHHLNVDVDQLISWRPAECNWKKIPKMLLAIDHERQRLTQEGVDPRTIESVYRDLVTYQNDWFTKKGGLGCGSPKEFFQRYKP
jgi:hypothetical protein